MRLTSFDLCWSGGYHLTVMWETEISFGIKTYVAKLICCAGEGTTECRWWYFIQEYRYLTASNFSGFDGDLLITMTHNSPCTLYTNLNAKGTSCEAAEAIRNNPQRYESSNHDHTKTNLTQSSKATRQNKVGLTLLLLVAQYTGSPNLLWYRLYNEKYCVRLVGRLITALTLRRPKYGW